MTVITDLLDAGEKHARNILVKRRDKSLTAMFHLVAPDGRPDAVISTPWGNDLQKQIMVAAVKSQAREMHATAALFLSEAWMATESIPLTEWHRKRAAEHFTPPSQRPDRVEVVSMIATDGRDTHGRMLQIVRDKPGGRVIDLVRDGPDKTDMQSWMFEGMIG